MEKLLNYPIILMKKNSKAKKIQIFKLKEIQQSFKNHQMPALRTFLYSAGV